MAELTPKTITELTATTTLNSSDSFPISQSGSSKRVTWSTIFGKLGITSSATSSGGYVKLPGKILICWVYSAFSSVAITTQWGTTGTYYSAQQSLPNWPVAFSSAPSVLMSTQNSDEVFLGNNTNASTTSAGKFYAYRPISSASVNFGVTAVGFGKYT